MKQGQAVSQRFSFSVWFCTAMEGRQVCFESILLVATGFHTLWRSTCNAFSDTAVCCQRARLMLLTRSLMVNCVFYVAGHYTLRASSWLLSWRGVNKVQHKFDLIAHIAACNSTPDGTAATWRLILSLTRCMWQWWCGLVGAVASPLPRVKMASISQKLVLSAFGFDALEKMEGGLFISCGMSTNRGTFRTDE